MIRRGTIVLSEFERNKCFQKDSARDTCHLMPASLSCETKLLETTP
mgnify:CR=1 FL=1